MANQEKLDITYLKMCREWSQLSKATRMKVGCLIVKDNQIISDGFNGTPVGFDNKCEEEKFNFYALDRPRGAVPPTISKTLPEVLHAESNAITKLAKSTNSSDGATLYCTLSPCFDCAKLIIQAGIKRVVFTEEYRHGNGLDLLRKAAIIVEQKELNNE